MRPGSTILMLMFLLLQSLHAAYPPVYGNQGVVVAHDAEACQAGIEILEAGGNAVDAAIAVSYALAVTHPQAGNIGGGGFMLIHMSDGRSAAIDYREKAPGSASRDMYLDDSSRVIEGSSTQGGLAIGVPGTVAGMQLALDSFGSLSRRKLLRPAIRLAQRGFPLPFDLAYSFRWLNETAADFPETRAKFCRDGNLYAPGDIFKQPMLARTLRRIARQGNAGFYSGETAAAMVSTVQKYGGILELADLLSYQAVLRKPVTGGYRGYEILSMPPPSSGGIALISMLNMLETMEFDTIAWHSADQIQRLVEIEKRAYADRSMWLGDPDYFKVPQVEMVSKDYALQRMLDFSPGVVTPVDSILPMSQVDMDHFPHESEETTHFSVVDRWGNAVSVTTTLNWSFGSYVTVGEAGFLLNNEMDDFSAKPGVANSYGLLGNEANAIEPGKRMLSSMTPTIVLQEGQPFLILGTPGGSTIITSVLQVIHNVIDYQMPLTDAIQAPRFHHQWKPDLIYFGPRALSRETAESLSAMGYLLQPRSAIGEVNAIQRDPLFGGWVGVPDYRYASHGAGY